QVGRGPLRVTIGVPGDGTGGDGLALGLGIAQPGAQDGEPSELVRRQIHAGSAEAIFGIEAGQRAELNEVGMHGTATFRFTRFRPVGMYNAEKGAHGRRLAR
ncbi:MAG TPA: hypothetical protein VK898_04265, partial [Chloroflexota bacterium]|nr:hypothetical protein [Chloroflexota bacterium]